MVGVGDVVGVADVVCVVGCGLRKSSKESVERRSRGGHVKLFLQSASEHRKFFGLIGFDSA